MVKGEECNGVREGKHSPNRTLEKSLTIISGQVWTIVLFSISAHPTILVSNVFGASFGFFPRVLGYVLEYHCRQSELDGEGSEASREGGPGGRHAETRARSLRREKT